MCSDEVKDMVQRGAARVVSEQELADYSGSKFYLSKFWGIQPELEVNSPTYCLQQ